MPELVKIAVTAVSGRMGRAIVQTLLADAEKQLRLSSAVHREGSKIVGLDVGEVCRVGRQGIEIGANLQPAEFDLLIDFSQVESSVSNLDFCRRHNKPVVLGTTGFDESQKHLIEAAAKDIPIVFSPNMSIGVNVCFHLLKQTAGILGDDSDIEILEAHHRHKLDAPSGTALRMGEIIAAETGRDLAECAVYGRAGLGERRAGNSIGFASLRAGDIVGDHTVMFAGDGERVEIRHSASSRLTFARGAVRAAAWLSQQQPGLYDMQDVLNLNS